MNRKPHDKPSQAQASKAEKQPDDANPDLQGEGNYTATRRYRKSAEAFVESGKVEQAAKEAAPKNEAQRRELEAAESEGRSHARK